MKPLTALSIFGIATFLWILGCGSSTQTETAPPAPADSDNEHSDHDHSEHSHQGETSQADRERAQAELAKLSPEDAASAERQHICPVSGEMLGTMGPPIKVDANGRQVWICCEGCQDELLENPDKYLAKLSQE